MDKRKQPGFDPKGIGEKSSAQILALFLEHDKRVLIPFGDNQRYDLVVDDDGDFVRVQCKTAALMKNGNGFVFPTCSTNWYSGTNKNYRGAADIFAVYLRERREVFILGVDKCPLRECSVRLVPAANKQKKGVRLAEDYLFDPEKSLRSYG